MFVPMEGFQLLGGLFCIRTVMQTKSGMLPRNPLLKQKFPDISHQWPVYSVVPKIMPFH